MVEEGNDAGVYPPLAKNGRRAPLIAPRRGQLGISQGGLAKRIGISRQSLSAIETGVSSPSVEVALLIAKTLGTTVEDLFLIGDSIVEAYFDLERFRDSRVAVGEIGSRLIARRLSSRRDSGPTGASDGRYVNGEFVWNSPRSTSIFLSGCDPSLGVLVDWLNIKDPTRRYRWISAQNSTAEAELAVGVTHFALRHGVVGPKVANSSYAAFDLCDWTLAVAVKGENPLRISSLGDAIDKGARWAARPKGSGTLETLALELLELRLDIELVNQTSSIFLDHQSAVEYVALGDADYVLAAECIARDGGLDVVGGISQRSHLYWDEKNVSPEVVSIVINEAKSREFRRELESMSGYHLIG